MIPELTFTLILCNILRWYRRVLLILVAEKEKPNKAILKIYPAFTWKQPKNVETPSPDADTPSLLVLNDNCLLVVFIYCCFDDCVSLWQVCHKTRNLLDKHILRKFTACYIVGGITLWHEKHRFAVYWSMSIYIDIPHIIFSIRLSIFAVNILTSRLRNLPFSI